MLTPENLCVSWYTALSSQPTFGKQSWICQWRPRTFPFPRGSPRRRRCSFYYSQHPGSLPAFGSARRTWPAQFFLRRPKWSRSWPGSRSGCTASTSWKYLHKCRTALWRVCRYDRTTARSWSGLPGSGSCACWRARWERVQFRWYEQVGFFTSAPRLCTVRLCLRNPPSAAPFPQRRTLFHWGWGRRRKFC